jgi:transcriptional regulator with XRE-family HTH domain
MSDRLKSSRHRLGWTQEDLAQEAMVGIATIRRIEQHMDEPHLDTVRRLAGTLRIRPAWLAFGEEPCRCSDRCPGGEADGGHDR